VAPSRTHSEDRAPQDQQEILRYHFGQLSSSSFNLHQLFLSTDGLETLEPCRFYELCSQGYLCSEFIAVSLCSASSEPQSAFTNARLLACINVGIGGGWIENVLYELDLGCHCWLRSAKSTLGRNGRYRNHHKSRSPEAERRPQGRRRYRIVNMEASSYQVEIPRSRTACLPWWPPASQT
jgi:hypothetical protein